ncbi:MAG: hypothetical protein M3130_03890 [Actinomycetota bacterium]|nr:hypothetical protein [Actinomycetota bacterium]
MPQQSSESWRPIRRAPWRPVSAWAERSQRGACHNAMVASTALAASMHEREEVARYLDAVAARTSGATLSLSVGQRS